MYGYFISCLIVLVIWLILFLTRKDLRKQILLMSFFIGIIGPLSEIWYWRDWWQPEMILSFDFFEAKLGVEDFLFGFGLGGVGAVLYEVILGKSLLRERRGGRHNLFIAFGALLAILSMVIFNNIFQIHTFYVTILIILGMIAFIWWRRPDLILNSILSGVFLTLVLIPFLGILKIYPNLIQEQWFLNQLSGILVFGIPIEDIFWFFLWGMVGGPLYEFWQGYKLTPIKEQ